MNLNKEWDGLPMPSRLWAILAVAFGVSLSVIDGTIANVALPTLARTLEISSANSIWIVNAYQLAIVISLLSFSALGDTIGYRKIYLIGLVVFTVASVGCTFASSLPTLVAARICQGFGAAAITSVNTTLIRFIYPRHQLGRGMGINATVVAVSSVAGPTIASGILSIAPWPWLFAINIPIGIVAFVLSKRFLPANPVHIEGRRFDWRDGAMNALTFGLLILCIEGYSHAIELKYIFIGIALLIVVGTYFVRTQLRKPFPILPFDLLKKPIFSVSIATSICSFVAQTLAMVALPFYLQQSLGYTQVHTGFLMTAWPAVIMVVAPIAGRLVERIHAGAMGGVGLLIMMSGLLLLAFLPGAAHPVDIIWRLVVCGIGFGLFQSPNNSIIVGSAPRERSGSASGMLATARLLGQTTGAALVALLFHTTSERGSHIALILAAGLAGLGSIISFSRLSLPLPKELRK